MTISPVILNGKSITLNGTTITVDNSGQLVIDGAKISSNNLFDFKYSDYLLNDPNWVNADANNWCSSTNYPNAYEHLTDDLDGITSETETIGSYTITFYRATDGHKICLADQETTIANIFTETGVAWYYLVDTANTRFKLPRNQFGFVGIRNSVSDFVNESLPNITGKYSITACRQNELAASGALYGDDKQTGYNGGNNGRACPAYFGFDASLSSPTYQNNAPVQQRAIQTYLNFYLN